MKACIISIGDELLIGQTINTNAAWMGAELNLIGIDVLQAMAVSDKEEEIIRALNEGFSLADVLLITGGLGPTKDDITKHTLCKYFDTHLEINQEVLDRITAFFAKRNRPMLETNIKQAEIPVGCKMVVNNNGTAQGMWFEKNDRPDDPPGRGKICISMPGVPYEMKGMMTETILPELSRINGETIVHRTLLTTGIGESFLAEKIKDIEDDLRAQGLGLAYLPSPGMVKLRVTAKGKDKNALQKQVDGICERLVERVEPQHYFAEGSDTLEKVIARMLTQHKKQLGVIESCTGGRVGQMIVSVPGASVFFNGAITAYAYSVKESVLGINHDRLQKEGAVSEWCAMEMAVKGRQLMGADICISTTGIAGPDGGTEDKPVGTVWIGFASKDKVFAKRFLFGDNRERNIQMSAMAALNLLRLELL